MLDRRGRTLVDGEGVMASNRRKPNTNNHGEDAPKHRASRGLLPSTMGGAMFGGVMGSALGPLGAAAGMVIGGLAGEAVERHYDRERDPADSKPAS